MKRLTVSGWVPLDVQVIAEDEEAAKLAWHGALAVATVPTLSLPGVEMAFFTDGDDKLFVDDVSGDDSLGEVPDTIPEAPTLDLDGSAAEQVCDWAGSFIDHWQSDEGQDDDEQAAADKAADDLERFRPFLVQAANSYTPDAIRQIRSQLGIVRTAVERAREVLTTAAETHPDDGSDQAQVENAPEGGIAGECARAGQDLTEALDFLAKALGRLPLVIPDRQPPAVAT